MKKKQSTGTRIIRRLAQRRSIRLGAVVTLTAVVGLSLLTVGSAATYNVPFEAETGRLGGNAANVTASGASGGSAVRFGSATNPTPTPSPSPSPVPTPTPPAGGSSKKVEITYYGSYDNDPAGSTDIAHPVIHDEAGGTGTYDDPLTFASPAGSGPYSWGQIIYVPSVQKYFIREDECATSWTAPDGCGPVSHVDLYIGNPSDNKSVLACEEALTPGATAEIIVDAPDGLAVDPKPLWNQSTGTCGILH